MVELVDQLTATSDVFGAMWADHEVAARRFARKRIIHPEVGLLDLMCEVLVGTNGEQLVVLFARPGTDTREKLDLLRVIGTQNLAATPSEI